MAHKGPYLWFCVYDCMSLHLSRVNACLNMTKYSPAAYPYGCAILYLQQVQRLPVQRRALWHVALLLAIHILHNAS